jgi:hypothetical protein
LASLKHQLHALCLAHVETRIRAVEEAIRTTQQSANAENKSSAGDKYETGRAMAQLDIENLLSQKADIQNLLKQLSQINPDKKSERVERGSLVITNAGCFYLAVGAGPFLIEGISYMALSPGSPLGQKMSGLPARESFEFRNRHFVIEKVI